MLLKKRLKRGITLPGRKSKNKIIAPLIIVLLFFGLSAIIAYIPHPPPPAPCHKSLDTNKKIPTVLIGDQLDIEVSITDPIGEKLYIHSDLANKNRLVAIYYESGIREVYTEENFNKTGTLIVDIHQPPERIELEATAGPGMSPVTFLMVTHLGGVVIDKKIEPIAPSEGLIRRLWRYFTLYTIALLWITALVIIFKIRQRPGGRY